MEFLDDISNEDLHTVGVGMSRDEMKHLITQLHYSTRSARHETEIPMGEEGAEIVFSVHPEDVIQD